MRGARGETPPSRRDVNRGRPIPRVPLQPNGRTIMSYRITVFEPVIERRDHPELADQTQRTAAVKQTKVGAAVEAFALLAKHAEVTIYQDKNAGKALEGWRPSHIVIFSNPRWLGAEIATRGARTRILIDRHYYEYECSDGRKRQLTFE